MASLRPSLITSYVTAGTLSPSRRFSIGKLAPYKSEHYEGGHTIGAELYLFMEPDARRWRRHLRGGRSEEFYSAIEFLAKLTTGEIKSVAEEIATNLDAIGTAPTAIASFIPEIAAPDGSLASELAENSISSLLRFAVALRGSARTPPIVELVVGSTIERIEDVEDNGGLTIRTISDESGCKRVFTTLRRAFELARGEKAFSSGIDDVRVALELEPGPLYLLRDRRTLRIFADAMNAPENAKIASNVGFNLDIAHWWLADIEPTWLRESANADILSRVFHAHISGHSRKGHFGDISLCSITGTQKEEFKAWISFLAEETGSEFSGVVSVEYEAARGEAPVIESVREFLEWV